MSFFSYFNSLFSKPVVGEIEVPIPEITTAPSSSWREGMWVVSGTDVGILTQFGIPCEVHLVSSTGETTKVIKVSLNTIRQATWEEIPECRRCITKEQGKELGYGA